MRLFTFTSTGKIRTKNYSIAFITAKQSNAFHARYSLYNVYFLKKMEVYHYEEITRIEFRLFQITTYEVEIIE